MQFYTSRFLLHKSHANLVPSATVCEQRLIVKNVENLPNLGYQNISIPILDLLILLHYTLCIYV